MQVGLFLNNGAFEGVDDSAALQLSVESAKLAESLGYDRVWVTEHHFIDFGVCSQALTLAGFLLGMTQRIRVGTAVVLAPLVHPVTIAEQAAILDQAGDGRFDLGLGRGGYSLDYEVLSVPTERWSVGIEATVLAVIDALSNTDVSSDHELFRYQSVTVRPRPRTLPHPPMYVATATAEAVEVAARLRLPLQFYFAADTESRVKTIEQYRGFAQEHGWDGEIDHLHAIPCLVEEDEPSARSRMSTGMPASFNTGNHRGLQEPDLDLAKRAEMTPALVDSVIGQSPIGPPERVMEWFDEFIAATRARNFALYMEPIGDPKATLASIGRFANDVMPRLRRMS